MQNLDAINKNISLAPQKALQSFNLANNKEWDFGTNWSSVGQEDFETYVNKFLFPKIQETELIQYTLGNKFNHLAKELNTPYQLNEEYVFKDIVPVKMNLDKNATLLLKRNYPKMITKIYGGGILKKFKFTLNAFDPMYNFITLQDAIVYALGMYKATISSINVAEEREIKAMLVDYSLNMVPSKNHIHVNTQEELIDNVYKHMLYLQNNTHEYNESFLASNGDTGRFTISTNYDDIVILTSDDMKHKLLDTKIANTYNIAGLDITDKIYSFKNLGDVYILDRDYTVTNETKLIMEEMGDWQVEVGDVIPEGTVFTYYIPQLDGYQTEIKPISNELYAFVFDVNCIRYNRFTKGMLKKPFYNQEFDETTYMLHWYDKKNISPFYSKVTIGFNANAYTKNSDQYIYVVQGNKPTEQEIISDLNLELFNTETQEYLTTNQEYFKIDNYNRIDFTTVGTVTNLEISYNGVKLINDPDKPRASISVLPANPNGYTANTPDSSDVILTTSLGQSLTKEQILSSLSLIYGYFYRTELIKQYNVNINDVTILNYDEIDFAKSGDYNLDLAVNGEVLRAQPDSHYIARVSIPPVPPKSLKKEK